MKAFGADGLTGLHSKHIFTFDPAGDPAARNRCSAIEYLRPG